MAFVALAAALVGTTSTAWGALIAYDDFERPASNSLGTTPVGGYLWSETENPEGDRIQLVNAPISAADFNSRGSGSDPTAVINVGLTDVSVSAIMRSDLVASNNYFGGIRYRVPFPSAGFASDVNFATGGYSVEITQALWDAGRVANSVSLRWRNNDVLASVVYAPTFVTDTDYDLRVDAIGDSHKVYVDGTLVIDYTETTAGRDIAGAAGIGTFYGNWLFDNFTVNAIPEPSSFALISLAIGVFGAVYSRRRERNS
ncbi:MAG: PEP-CTERM sorting domain-containing protein [Planctomycetes bacterium]|nr:PEP-CTERM sorting domain-containing protein [Planctomycetota bacterium]